MKRKPKPKDIEKIFREGKQVDKALARAARRAIDEHKRAGLPLVYWEEGRAVLIRPEEAIRPNGTRSRRRRR